MAAYLGDIADLSQIVIGMFTAVAAIFGFLEYQKSKRARRIDLSLSALRNWDDKINHLTAAGMALLRESDNNSVIAQAIKNNQCIKINKLKHKKKIFGFLITSKNEIPPNLVNDIRISLINFINAWEFVAALYVSGRADNELIEEQLFPDGYVSETLSTIEPFMDLYGKESWKPIRTMRYNVNQHGAQGR